MAASTITRAAINDGTTPWNASTINDDIYDKIDEMFGGVGTYATLELGGALKINGALTQLTNDGGALGSSSLGWSDLFLASGGVINLGASDVTITHSTNTLTFAGASSGYVFNDGSVCVLTTSVGATGLNIAATANLAFAESSNTSYANMFRQASSAATVLANGYKYTTTANGFASSVGSSWAKSAIALSSGTISFYTDTAATTASGTDVTPTERMRLTSDGNVGIGVAPVSNTRLTLSSAATNQQYIDVLRLETSDSGDRHPAIQFVGNRGGALKYAKITMDGGSTAGTGDLACFAEDEHQWYTGSGTSSSGATLRMRLTSGGNLAIGATARLYLDGAAATGDTYIEEVSANNLRIVASGNERLRAVGASGIQITGALTVPTNTPIYLDGSFSGDTYIYEYTGNVIDFVAGGNLKFRVNGTATDLVSAYANFAIDSTKKLYLDGGGDTYITETAGDVLRMYAGGQDVVICQSDGLYLGIMPTTATAANMVYNTSTARIERSTSSLRWKHDVYTLDTDEALAAVMAMRPATYRGKTDADQRRHVGFIAEEMAEIAPLLCTYDEGGESGTPNYVTYDRVTAYLVAVVQQQQAEIDALKARIH